MENFRLVVEELRKQVDLAESQDNKKLKKRLSYTASIFEELDRRELDPKPFDSLLKRLKNLLSQSTIKPNEVTKYYSVLLKYTQKEHGLVPQNYYRNLWMILGMTIFGVPFGIVFGLALDNFAFFSIGLPIGMPIGMAVGAEKDKKAKEDGLQMAIEQDF